MIPIRPAVARLPVRGPALVALVLGLLGGAALGAPDDRVPRVGNDQLPVVGTCAPIERENVTHVMLGKIGWYLVAGVPEPVDAEQLREILAQRVGTVAPSPHGVWLQASRDHVWGHVVKARLTCAQAGVYRVGVRVISESDGQIYGFPLFLPAVEPPTGPAVTTASRLPIVVDPVRSEASSDPRFLWRAARAARENYDQDVVAEVRVGNNVNLQYALTVLDMLHRGGCAAVRLKTLTMVSRVHDSNNAEIRVVRVPRYPEDFVVPAESESPIVVPPLQPRTRPWSLHGANQPGALYMELEELPVRGEQRPTRQRDLGAPLPNYLRRGRMPEAVRSSSAARVSAWADGLGPTILEGLHASAALRGEMVVRLRDPSKLAPLLGPTVDAFPTIERIELTTLQLDVLLMHEGQPVGLLDITLLVSGGAVQCVFARHSDSALPAAYNVPPEPVDPFAAGVPGALRVFVEGLLLDLRIQPNSTLPLAPMADLLAGLPASAHDRVRASDPLRRTEAAELAARVRSLDFERLILQVRDAATAVTSGGRVIGALRVGLEAEEQALRLNAIEPRRAP